VLPQLAELVRAQLEDVGEDLRVHPVGSLQVGER
jgi:hypothetical protein